MLKGQEDGRQPKSIQGPNSYCAAWVVFADEGVRMETIQYRQDEKVSGRRTK